MFVTFFLIREESRASVKGQFTQIQNFYLVKSESSNAASLNLKNMKKKLQIWIKNVN